MTKTDQKDIILTIGGVYMLICIIIGLVIIFGTAGSALWAVGKKIDESRNDEANKRKKK